MCEREDLIASLRSFPTFGWMQKVFVQCNLGYMDLEIEKMHQVRFVCIYFIN
jgi:hypothetical protein